MRKLCYLLASLILSGTATAQGYRPDFDPSTLKGATSGPPNEVLVLGSVHLSGLPVTWDPTSLRLLNDRLANWHPAAIATEDVSGLQCDFMRRYPERYKDTIRSYCWDPAPAQAAIGLDVASATVQAAHLLAAWPASPTASQRRHLAALFLAGGEQGSALVQWLRLPEPERHPGDGLDDTLVARLRKLESLHDESYLIGARLAVRLGHERLYAMDDHTADSQVTDEEGHNAAMTKAWDNPANKRRKQMEDVLRKQIDTPEGLLALYRGLNAPGMAKVVFDSDFGAALQDPSPKRFGRVYVGYWETRNLRMASNIREVMEEWPGVRVLVVVGASHKGYLEVYLNQMHDVRVVDAAPLLRLHEAALR
jgi:hypothetical protein